MGISSGLCIGDGVCPKGEGYVQRVLTPSGGHSSTYGRQADGTHPTGMLYCFITLNIYLFIITGENGGKSGVSYRLRYHTPAA